MKWLKRILIVVLMVPYALVALIVLLLMSWVVIHEFILPHQVALPNGYMLSHAKCGFALVAPRPAEWGPPLSSGGGGNVLLDPINKFAVTGNLVIGYVDSFYAYQPAEKKGYFVFDTGTKELKDSLDKSSYLDILKRKGIDPEPKLRDSW